MLFLPGIELCLEEFDTEFKFVIDDHLYFLYEESETWAMKTLNTRTFKLADIEVHVDDEMSLTDFYHTAVVHNKKVYIWNYEEQHLLEGSHDKEGFHWNKVETTGDSPDIGISFGYTEGTISYYCVVQMDDSEGVEYLYRLNLETIYWSRQAIPQPVQEIVDTITKSPLRNWHWDAFVTGTCVHFIPSVSKAESSRTSTIDHLMLDLITLDTSQLTCLSTPEYSQPIYRITLFSYDQQLWMFGYNSRPVKGGKVILFRCDTASQKWIEIASSNDLSVQIREPTTIGSRVIFIMNRFKQNGSSAVIQKIAYVIDFEPSLLDRAAVILINDPQRVEQARRSLPAHVIEDLTERRIFPGVEEDDQIEKEEDESKMEDQKEEDEHEIEENESEEDDDDNGIPPKRNRVE